MSERWQLTEEELAELSKPPRGKEAAEMVASATKINPLAIHDEYIMLPAHMAYWAARHADAVEARLRAEAEADQAEAARYVYMKQQTHLDGIKLTEKLADSLVRASPEWRDSQLRVAEARGNERRLAAIVEACKAKADMLVSLGATIRKEMEGLPQLRRDLQNRRAMIENGQLGNNDDI